MVWERISPAQERAAYYQAEAERLRGSAEAEPIESIRALLLSAAQLYQELAHDLWPREKAPRLSLSVVAGLPVGMERGGAPEIANP